MSTEWLSVPGAAHELGIGTMLVYRLINEGKLTAYRLGRVYRIRSVDIAAYLETARVKPGELEHLVPERYDAPRHIDLRAVESNAS